MTVEQLAKVVHKTGKLQWCLLLITIFGHMQTIENYQPSWTLG